MNIIIQNNQYIGPVIWGRAELCDFNMNDGVDIWKINVSSHLQYINDLLGILEPAEIMRADKYYKEADRNRFIISRGSLRIILSRYLKQPAAAIRFKFMANNKPYINYPAAAELHFNLSDSADNVIIAVAKSHVGIDIEFIKPGFRYHDILNSNFSIPEANYINRHDSLKRFFLLWTRKEAILKATGIGLTDHLKLIPSLDGEHLMDGDLLSTTANWQLSSFDPCEGYIATIASDIGISDFRYWDFSY